MKLYFQLGLVLLASQALQIQGKVLNPDDNRSIQRPEDEAVSIFPPTIKQTPNVADLNLEEDNSMATTSPFDNIEEIRVIQPIERKSEHYSQPRATFANADAGIMKDVTANVLDGTTMMKEIREVRTVRMVSAANIQETHSSKKASDFVTVTDNPAAIAEVTESEIESNDTVKNSTNTNADTFVIPDGIESFANSIMLEGHVFGIRDDLMSMIHSALSSGDIFVPVEPLTVNPLSNSFEETGYEGDKYTHVRYVVRYNGRPIHTEIITRVMSSPKVSHHLHEQLEGRHLREYKTAKQVEHKSWIHQHLAAVVISSCVAFVLIILVVSIIVARRRSTGTSKQDKKRPPTLSKTKEEKKGPPPPYSVDNPVYEFETNAVMDGYTLP